MSGFVLFGGILVVLLTTIVRAVLRAADDTGVALAPDERCAAAIEALRDLELEYRTGKLAQEEYKSIRSRLEREAIRARDKAEELRVVPDSVSGCGSCGAELEEDASFCNLCGVATDT